MLASSSTLPVAAEHENDADHRFLHVRPDALRPGQEQRAGEGGGERRDLNRDALGLESDLVGEHHAAAGDLGDRQVDEDDSAREHLHAQRHVRRGDEQARQERRQQD